ncbi:MAG: POT family proton-dependent oligopeptide transporter [Hyphomicrobiaceae bacterium]|jgi:POT family proton-dependent oligopeptide transporter
MLAGVGPRVRRTPLSASRCTREQVLMSSTPYRTAPTATTSLPGGISYIVSNEAAERFSYYGMRGILVIFMTKHLMAADGSAAPMTEPEARAWFHVFAAAVYFFPLLGAVLSDYLLGKFRTILILSVVYCLGHLALAMDETRLGLAIGLGLISLGSGGIKPCVSAHVGDQFGAGNASMLPKVFGWFYLAINLGAFVSSLLTPWLLEYYGSHVAFGVPGLLMLTATWVFWLGRNRFVHVPPAGPKFRTELADPQVRASLWSLCGIYVFVAVFWSLYDQTASAWVQQAAHMNREFLGVHWLSAQIQAINPVLILTLVPIFSYVIYPLVGRVVRLTSIGKIAVGLFLTIPAFLIPAWVETQIAVGLVPSIGWQLLAYLLITAAEVLVSITCLEFSYTQAPRSLKSVVMSLYFLSVTAGNLLTSGVNFFIERPDGSLRLEGAAYYLLFAGFMTVAAIAFTIATRGYRETLVLQEES